MRDFTREAVTGTKPGMELPAPEFSWSLSRHYLFRKCPLAYWIRYGLSQGGWDELASDLSSQARQAGKTLAKNTWFSLFAERLAGDALLPLRTVSKNFRLRVLNGRMEQLLCGRLVDLADGSLFTYGHFPPVQTALSFPALVEELRPYAISFSESFLKSDLCRLIADAQGPTAFLPEKTDHFPFDDFTVWFQPGIVWKERNTVCSLRIMDDREPDEFQEQADLWDLAVRKQHREASSLFIVFAGNQEGKWKETPVMGDAVNAERMIRESASLMKEKVRDESMNLLDFPPAEDPQSCNHCRYAGVCRKVEERYGLF